MERKSLSQQMAESFDDAEALERQIQECKSCTESIRKETTRQWVEQLEKAHPDPLAVRKVIERMQEASK